MTINHLHDRTCTLQDFLLEILLIRPAHNPLHRLDHLLPINPVLARDFGIAQAQNALNLADFEFDLLPHLLRHLIRRQHLLQFLHLLLVLVA